MSRTRLIAGNWKMNKTVAEAEEYIQALLPPPSRDGPVRTDWVYVPCARLAGDAFGYGQLDDDVFVAYLIDVAGHGPGLPRLLEEVGDAVLLVGLEDAELADLAQRHRDGAHREVGVPLQVEADHLPVVHLVDVVAGEDQDVPRLLLLDGVDVLVERVGGALVPVLVDPLLGRQHVHVLVQLGAEEVPADAEVAVESAGLVLGQHEDAAEVAVDAVGQGEVDDAVQAAERHGRLGPVARQRLQARPLSPRKDDGEDVSHGFPLVRGEW